MALRIRPLNRKEEEEDCTECLHTISGEQQVIFGKNKAFKYDYVFCQKSPKVEIYEQCVQSLLEALFKGYNATVLAYGQTGSGKTHTMGSGTATLATATQNEVFISKDEYKDKFIYSDIQNLSKFQSCCGDSEVDIDKVKISFTFSF